VTATFPEADHGSTGMFKSSFREGWHGKLYFYESLEVEPGAHLYPDARKLSRRLAFLTSEQEMTFNIHLSTTPRR